MQEGLTSAVLHADRALHIAGALPDVSKRFGGIMANAKQQ